MTIIIPDHTDQAVAWLKLIRPKGPWTLASINPDGGEAPDVESFRAEELGAVREWVETRNGNRNLHITINPTKRRMSRKPKEVDIGRADFAHVDCDPLDHETPEEALKRHRANLESGAVPPPSMTYVSGNGLVALWRLDPQVKIKSAEDIENVKAINAALAQRLGGKAAGYDSCHSIDHLFRLLYTLNIPDARKRAKGRVPVMSGDVVNHPDRSYATYELPQDSPSPSIAPEQTRLGPVEDVEDLDKLTLPPHVRELVEVSWDDDTSGKYPSRSERDFAGITGLLRNQVRPGQVVGILLNDDYALGERLQERDDPEAAARKEVERAVKKLGPIDAASDFDTIETPEKKAKTLARFKALKLSEVMAAPDPKWLIEGVLAQNALFEVFGQFKAGKTFFGLEMALCIATGRDYFDTKTTQGSVIYVIAEGNKKLFGYRVQAWIKERAGGDRAVFEQLSADVEANFSVVPVSVHMDAPKTVEAFLEANPGKYTAVFVDTLMRNMTGDPLKAADLMKFMAGCDTIRDKSGAAVVFFHHMRREGGVGGFGSIVGEAFVDGAAIVYRKGKERHFKLHIMRDGDDSAPAWVCQWETRNALLSMSEAGEVSRNTAVLIYQRRGGLSVEEQVLVTIGDAMPDSLDRLVNKSRLKKRTVQRKLAELRAAGLVMPDTLRLTPEGKEAADAAGQDDDE
jgi:hypothetical protein